MHVVEGHLAASGARFGLVASRTNDIVVSRLVDGAVDTLKRLGASESDLVLARVPGAWEIPLALRDLARSTALPFDALIALGAVLRGGTPHFEYVCAEVSKGVLQVSFELDLPVAFGVLTCDSLEQALERSGAKAGNKGAEAAFAAVESVDLRRRLRAGASGLAR